MSEPFISSDANAITSAVGWIENTLLGTVATAVAIIAVAAVGILLLAGRVDVHRATQVVFGCFIILGASTFAADIYGAPKGLSVQSDAQFAQSLPPPSPLPAMPVSPSTPATPFDPYAGAAVPRR